MIRRIVLALTATFYALLLGAFILSMAAWYANELHRPACSEPCGALPPSYGSDC